MPSNQLKISSFFWLLLCFLCLFIREYSHFCSFELCLLQLGLSCWLVHRCQMPQSSLCSLWALVVPSRCLLHIFSLIHPFVSSDSALNSGSPCLRLSCLWRGMNVMVLNLPQLFLILSFLKPPASEVVLASQGRGCAGGKGGWVLEPHSAPEPSPLYRGV